jgi:hypothetical protein
VVRPYARPNETEVTSGPRTFASQVSHPCPLPPRRESLADGAAQRHERRSSNRLRVHAASVVQVADGVISVFRVRSRRKASCTGRGAAVPMRLAPG